MARAYVSPGRLTFLTLAVFAGFVGILARLVYLHAIAHEELAAQAAAHRKTDLPIYGRRGSIIDSRGNLLASTRPVIDLGVDPTSMRPEDEPKLPELARLLKVSEAEVRNLCLSTTRDGTDGAVRLIRWAKLGVIDDPTYEQITKLGIKAVYGNRRYERYYPGGPLAAHLVGYVNKEGNAVMGVESFMDFYLHEQSGWRETEKDGRRRELAQFVVREVPARDGLSVQLTIDSFIQSMVENEIARLVREYRPSGVSIIVSDPRTGAILALGNYPNFDPNAFWETPVDNQRNRAMTDVYEPGSTFKIVTVAAGLEEGIIRPESLIDCRPPVVEYKGRKVKLPSDHDTLGSVPVRTVVAKSSNRGAARIGMMLGEQRMYEYAHRFGYGERTGWGLVGEVSGTLHEVKNWDGLTISRLPAGYALNATPLQVHFGMATVANGGVLMRPQLIRAICDADGKPLLEFTPRVRHRAISERAARSLAEMMIGVVGPEGTAKKAMIAGFEVAGKTGTARKILNGHYSDRNHVGSFAGFFPAKNPEIAITIVVDDAQSKGVGYGGIVAAPSFRIIGEQLVQYLSIQANGAAPAYADSR